MTAQIFPVLLGFDHCYIIRDTGTILVDGGAPKKAKELARAREKIGVNMRDIKLIVLTHGHWDHIGSVKDIKDLTGAKVALHQQEKDWLEKSMQPLPPGVTAWGSIFSTLLSIFTPMINIPATNVDIVLGDAGFSLAEYGVPGRILHTPGHSPGSVSILLETGDAFVGDLAMSEFPMRFSPGLPIMAENIQKVRESWKSLIDAGAKTIYPAHGKPFSVEMMRRALL